MNAGRALAQCGQQQHAVRNAFGARSGDSARSAAERGNVQKFCGKHQGLCLEVMLHLLRVWLAFSSKPSKASTLPLDITNSNALRLS